MAKQHDELARLLEHARADAPSEQLLSDVRERMLSSLADAPVVESMIAPRAPVAPRPPVGVGLKLVIGGVILGLAVLAYFAQRPAPLAPARAPEVAAPSVVRPAPATPPIEAVTPPEPAPTLGPAPEPPVLEPKRKPLRPARHVEPLPPQATPAAPAAVPAPSSSFAEEVKLIQAALEAQRAGRTEEARAKLAEHVRRFPEGQLVNERKRIEARLPQ